MGKGRLIDETGNEYGLLTVTGRDMSKLGYHHGAYWLCECECGGTTSVQGVNLRSGAVKSCGCQMHNNNGCLPERGTRNPNAKTNHQLHKTWESMNTRCHNPGNKNYAGYGGKGIRVCDRWRKGLKGAFDAFIADVGERPEGMSLDRINPFGDYEPLNCRWATSSTQAINTKANYAKVFVGPHPEPIATRVKEYLRDMDSKVSMVGVVYR